MFSIISMRLKNHHPVLHISQYQKVVCKRQMLLLSAFSSMLQPSDMFLVPAR